MKCPYCSTDDSKVIDSRPTSENNSIRRRRECIKCNARFTTYERIEDQPIIIVKKDETREEFNPNKVMNGMIRACEKRPVSAQQMEQAVSRIEQKLANMMKKEIRSKEVGELVMQELKDLDEIAYVRFASVYKSFKDIDTFVSELKKILNEKKH